MGTWNSKPFGNDSALDWLTNLMGEQNTLSFIQESLNSVLKSSSSSDCDKEQAAVAASFLISISCYEPVKGIPKEGKDWIIREGFVPTQKLIKDAYLAVTKILEKSELRNMWDEDGNSVAWLRSTQNISTKLKEAKTLSLPIRDPKKKTDPRLLYKLVKEYKKNQNELIRKKIRSKIWKLKDVNAPSRDTHLDSPLNLMAKNGLYEEVTMLLNAGANPNYFVSGRGSPLWSACRWGFPDIAKILLDSGASDKNLKVYDEDSGKYMDLADSQKQLLQSQSKLSSELEAAAKYSEPRMIDLLLEYGANLDQINHGHTLLHISCESGNGATTAHLIELGMDVNKGTVDTNETPLHRAVYFGHYHIVEILLEAGAKCNVIEQYEYQKEMVFETPLDYIKKKPNADIFKILRQYGAKLAKEL